uniref:Uncharacterized protein n=1 Tax=Rhizophora mucronata TaxID=61149 RepID=A0A2P2NIX4_RHIMU
MHTCKKKNEKPNKHGQLDTVQLCCFSLVHSFLQNVASNETVLLTCKVSLLLNKLEYFFKSATEFLSYVSSDSLLELGAFQPRDSNIDITLACAVSTG